MGCAMDVVALAFEMCNDVVDRIEKGFIILEREDSFPFESGSNAMGQLPPQTAGDVEVRAEIKEGTVFGGTVFAIGFDEGKAVAFLTVFTFVGSVSDKNDRSVKQVRGMVPGYWGEVPVHTAIAPHCLFQKSRPINAEYSRNSPM